MSLVLVCIIKNDQMLKYIQHVHSLRLIAENSFGLNISFSRTLVCFKIFKKSWLICKLYLSQFQCNRRELDFHLLVFSFLITLIVVVAIVANQSTPCLLFFWVYIPPSNATIGGNRWLFFNRFWTLDFFASCFFIG